MTGKLGWSKCRLGLKLVIQQCAFVSLLNIISEMMLRYDSDGNEDEDISYSF